MSEGMNDLLYTMFLARGTRGEKNSVGDEALWCKSGISIMWTRAQSDTENWDDPVILVKRETWSLAVHFQLHTYTTTDTFRLNRLALACLHMFNHLSILQFYTGVDHFSTIPCLKLPVNWRLGARGQSETYSEIPEWSETIQSMKSACIHTRL